jgi:hypothetical protein
MYIRSLKNERIVQVSPQLIDHHVVDFVVLDVVDFHVVELTCLIYPHHIAGV